MNDSERNDYIRTLGLPFLAHLLRRVSDQMVAEAGAWEEEALGVRAPPRTASTMLLLANLGPLSVTELAERLRVSHPLMISWLRQLQKQRFVKSAGDPNDARRTLMALTAAGRAEAKRMAEGSERIGRAYARLLREADADVFAALWRVHDLIEQGRLAALLRR